MSTKRSSVSEPAEPEGEVIAAPVDPAAARATLEAVQKRVEAAKQTLDTAKAQRTALVMKLAGNGTVTPAEQRSAEEAVRSAESSLLLLTEASASATRAVQVADNNVKATLKAEADRRFAAAKARRMKAAELLDQIGKDFAAAVSEFNAAGAEVNDSWTLGRVPLSSEIESLRDRRLPAAALPEAVQVMIVQTGSVRHFSLATRERAIWGLQS